MKPFRFKRRSKGFVPPSAEKPKFAAEEQPEQLMGEVNGMKASAPEERLANALRRQGLPFMFRYSVGAPRNMPGWKELDFLIQSKGYLYAVEVDTAFTHRNKANSDILHDAIILNDKEIASMGELYPKVFHADGDSSLANEKNAQSYVKQVLG